MNTTTRIGFVALVAVAAVAVVAYGLLGGFDRVEAAVEVGKKMPNFTMKDYEGKEHTLEKYKGKIVVLEFCSQKCPFSRGADPQIAALYKEFKDDNVIVLGVDSHKDTPPKEIKEYAKKVGKPYPVLKDSGNTYADAVGAKRTPEIFVVDKEGNLAYHGAFDDRSSPEGDASNHYTKDAVAALVDGKEPEVKSVKAWGCTIKRAN